MRSYNARKNLILRNTPRKYHVLLPRVISGKILNRGLSYVNANSLARFSRDAISICQEEIKTHRNACCIMAWNISCRPRVASTNVTNVFYRVPFRVRLIKAYVTEAISKFPLIKPAASRNYISPSSRALCFFQLFYCILLRRPRYTVPRDIGGTLKAQPRIRKMIIIVSTSLHDV